MCSDKLRDICVTSCGDMFEQMTVMQESAESTNNNVSTVVNDIKGLKYNSNGYWEIYLHRKIQDLDRIGIRILDSEGKTLGDYGSNDVHFDEYDEYGMSIHAFVSDELNSKLNRDVQQIKIVSDMKWLISLTQDMFNEYGEKVGYPRKAPSFSHDDYSFPKYPGDGQPTQQQRDAVHTILNSKMSYIWGAPGTGKTQFVLSTAIIAHIKKGHRIAIIAPTNNSLEQVLRGVMKVISTDDPEHGYIDPKEDIIRLGTPTQTFIKDFGEMCENKAISKELRSIDNQLRNLDIFQLASEADFLINTLNKIRRTLMEREDTKDQYQLKELNDDIDTDIDYLRERLKPYDTFSNLMFDVTHVNIDSKIDNIEKEIHSIDKSKLSQDTYIDLDEEELRNERDRLLEERSKLEKQETNSRIRTAKIMAMTPYILMSRRKTLFDAGGIVDVDQIFIDEVGYCNLIQTMPVFMCGPPVAMLGDHMQLPPVCELDDEVLASFFTEPNDNGYMKYGFMWDQSVLHIEDYLTMDIDECGYAYVNDNDPVFIETKKCDLTESHRFSENIAEILDKCVYKNGIRSIGKNPEDSVSIECIDVRNGGARDKRANPGEADAIADYIENNMDELDDFVILTPYKDQRSLLEKKCKCERDRIMTIHSSQGREWNTVIMSICDDDKIARDVPLRLTSSIDGYNGLRVMNTAVSRAQKKIILVCNHDFWKGRAERDDLLGVLADSSEVLYRWPSCQ